MDGAAGKRGRESRQRPSMCSSALGRGGGASWRILVTIASFCVLVCLLFVTVRFPPSVHDAPKAPLANACGVPAPGGLPAGTEASGFVGFLDSVVDLGNVPWATEELVPLTFVNHSQEPVTLDFIESTCGCALVHGESAYHGQILLSGDELLVEITMNMGDRPGLKQALIRIVTTAGNVYPTLVQASVSASWSLSADEVSFGQVFFDDMDDPVRTVIFSSDSDLLARVPESSVPWLACSIQSREGGKPEDEIRLRVLSDRMSPGMNTGIVEVITTNPLVPSQHIFVSARGTPALMPYPAHLVLLPGTKGSIRFSDETREQASLVSVDIGRAPLEVTIVPTGLVKVAAETMRRQSPSSFTYTIAQVAVAGPLYLFCMNQKERNHEIAMDGSSGHRRPLQFRRWPGPRSSSLRRNVR